MNLDSNIGVVRIYTKWVARELRQSGFEIIRTEPNFNKPQLDVYLFRDSDEFRKEFTRLSSVYSNNKASVK